MSVDLPSSDTTAVAVSIVVPVRNEAENVAPLIAEIAAALDGGWVYEIIYVNDGSTDATAERLAAVMQQRGDLRQIRHATSSGQSAAVRNAILRDGTRDTGCGLKAFRREVFLALPYFDGLHRFLPALVRREGYEIAYVDVIDRPRRSGVSNYGFFDRLWIGIMVLAGVWWLIRRKNSTPVATEVTS